jgi:hypothetical protein
MLISIEATLIYIYIVNYENPPRQRKLTRQENFGPCKLPPPHESGNIRRVESKKLFAREEIRTLNLMGLQHSARPLPLEPTP